MHSKEVQKRGDFKTWKYKYMLLQMLKKGFGGAHANKNVFFAHQTNKTEICDPKQPVKCSKSSWNET